LYRYCVCFVFTDRLFVFNLGAMFDGLVKCESDCWLRHICLSVRMERPGCHWIGFSEIPYFRIFRISVKKNQVILKSDNNNSHFT
jgi:hypothetical protein